MEIAFAWLGRGDGNLGDWYDIRGGQVRSQLANWKRHSRKFGHTAEEFECRSGRN